MGERSSVERIIARVTEEVGSDRFDRYFGKQAELSFDGRRLNVTVTTAFVADLIGRRFGDCLRRAAQEEAGGEAVEVRFSVDRTRFLRAEGADPPRDRPMRPGVNGDRKSVV